MWAVGEDFTTGGPLFEHWNGTAWRVFPVPNPFPAVEAPVVDVERVPGTGRLWAVGQGVAFQFAHDTWTFSPMPGFAAVDSVTIPAQRDVWAVGSSAGGGITEHFDGSRWTKFFSKGLFLGVVASVSPHDIWATATDERFGVPLRLAHLNAARTAWMRSAPAIPESPTSARSRFGPTARGGSRRHRYDARRPAAARRALRPLTPPG